ncbi:MAG TPA: hypothetical protein VLF40_04410 [Candidatus Saccharimonadales bacterium]|nr:hypothetical protein [Candidatus Saccharimonadales bacterium]
MGIIKQRNPEDDLPHDMRMSHRASPFRAAAQFANPQSAVHSWIMHNVRRANINHMNAKLTEQDGVIRGYHGTTRANAEAILRNGPENRRNEEGGFGFSIWDEEVALESLEYVDRRSREVVPRQIAHLGQGALGGEGVVLYVEARNPRPDTTHGRLEWLADAANVRVIRAFTPPEMVQMFGGVSSANIHITAVA